MESRKLETSGLVKFPVNDPTWQNSREGGMFVKLVVCENRDDKWLKLCSGAFVMETMSGSLMGDHLRPRPASGVLQTIEAINAEEKAIAEWESYHFPDLNEPGVSADRKYCSSGYLAVVVLGTTNWSGWNEQKGESWVCGFEDLTEEGKAFYRQMEMLYPGCDLHLLTFLDT